MAELERPCVWWLPGCDHKLAGTVSFAGSSTISGEIFDVPYKVQNPNGVDGSWHSEKLGMPVCRGRLRDGMEFALFRATIFHHWPGRTHVEAEFGLRGALPQPGMDPTMPFSGIEIEIEGLLLLSGTRPIDEVRWPTSRDFEAGNASYSFKWSSESEQTWVRGDDQITFKYELEGNRMDMFQYTALTYPVVHVSGPPRTLADWLTQYSEPIRSLVELATARPQSISRITMRLAEDARGRRPYAQYFSPNVTQDRSPAIEPRHHDALVLFSCGPSGHSLGELLDRWQQARVSNKVFMELYTSSFRDVLPVRSQLLLFLPALESLHSAKFGVGPMSREEFRSRRKKVIKHGKWPALSQVEFKWLRLAVKTLSSYTLEERLRGLVSTLPEDLAKYFDIPSGRLPLRLRSINGGIWTAVQRVRNDLAHGLDEWSDEEVTPLLRLVQTLATAVALTELRVDTDPLVEAIQRGDWLHYSEY